MRELAAKMIFGNLPLLGITYQGAEKDEECRRRFSDKIEMKKVLEVAIKHGIRYFASSSHNFNELVPTYMEAISEVADEKAAEVQLIPCLGIPLEFKGKRIDDYRRWATYLEYETRSFGDVKGRYLNDPILNCRFEWKENLMRAKPYKLKELERELRVNWNEWEDVVFEFSDYYLAWVEPGSESDFLAISRMDLLQELVDRTREFDHKVLLGIHHAGASIPLIEKEKVKTDGYVTPINKLGAMMFPIQQDAEVVIKKTREAGKLVIGIKPLAGGRIEPKEALRYVYKRVKADSCMIGVSSAQEAEEDFRIARNISENSRFLEE
ncbi:MAG: hypothetical protein ACUVUE_07395 [Candidatus Bathycorpusculaceae bacterium]